jgi:ABC-type spermidine/putrescine transport system permease subunit II
MMIILTVIGEALLAGLIAVGMNRLFPKRGNWLPVLFTTFVPPAIFIGVSVYRALVQLGMSAGPDGHARPGALGLFMASVHGYVFFTIIWLFVAVPSAFAALHLFRRK